jgi:hypothetical protein
MKIDILHVPDCPNLPMLEQRLREALDTADATASITTVVVSDLETATTTGMTGSPTLLIDGTDPFAEPGSGPSLSCRLYREADGRVSGAPSVTALRDALRTYVGAGQRCAAVSSTTSLPDWRARAIPTDAAERAVHQGILRGFATVGAPPPQSVLEEAAASFGTSADVVLRRLRERDVIRLDHDGRIRAAYPFSAVPAGHRVQLAGGPTVEAMCVIDALGIPAMLDTDAVITTTAPTGGTTITVTVTGGHATWDPPTAVVFLSAQASDGPSADTCCGYLNAFPDRDAGWAWSAAHPDIPGDLVDTSQAEQLGRHIFGRLLAADNHY